MDDPPRIGSLITDHLIEDEPALTAFRNAEIERFRDLHPDVDEVVQVVVRGQQTTLWTMASPHHA